MKLAQVKVWRHATGDKVKVVYQGSLREWLKEQGCDAWWAGQLAQDIREYGGYYWDSDLLVEPA